MTAPLRHARDIPDTAFLSIVDRLQRADEAARGVDLEWTSVMRWEVAAELGRSEGAGRYGAPDPVGKIVLAKARRLIRRGLLDGCYCGCRGDLSLTERGRTYLDAESRDVVE